MRQVQDRLRGPRRAETAQLEGQVTMIAIAFGTPNKANCPFNVPAMSHLICLHSVMESDPIVYARRDDYFCNLSLYQDLELGQNVITPSSPRACGK